MKTTENESRNSDGSEADPSVLYFSLVIKRTTTYSVFEIG
jgi:hypothetical protein